MKLFRFTVAATLALAFIAPARAEDDGRERRRRGLERLRDRFDRDGDGRLSREERAALREFLRELRGGGEEPIPQTVFPGRTDLYKLADGPHEVRAIQSRLAGDGERDREIPLRITIPAGDGPGPLIVFCHGALGSKDGALPLVTYWASHGYVVIQPTFGDSISLMSDEEKRKFRSPRELVNSPRTLAHWDDRPRDVSRVLDSLDRLARDVEPLAGRIDPERIGVAGHSFGAHTTMLLAGLRLRSSRGEGPDFRDPRIRAAVMISPQGPGKAITPASYKAMRGPMLMITGDNDGTPIEGREDKAGAWRREAFEHLRATGDRYLLWIRGAHHGFGGINGQSRWPGAGPEAPDHVYYVKTATLAFFDAYLGGDAQARAYLNGDKLDRVTDGRATLAAK